MFDLVILDLLIPAGRSPPNKEVTQHWYPRWQIANGQWARIWDLVERGLPRKLSSRRLNNSRPSSQTLQRRQSIHQDPALHRPPFAGLADLLDSFTPRSLTS